MKWNPGYGMASATVLYPGSSILEAEMDAIKGHAIITSYRVLITWAAIETAKGVYDFTLLDSTLDYLKNHLDTPRRMVVVVLPGYFVKTKADSSAIPSYILNDSAYGPSPVAGSYGWWGGTGNGNTSAACLHRTAVNDRWIALHQALGAHYDAEPYFEAIMFQEDSWIISASSKNGCPDYSTAAWAANARSLVTATLAAFPHTNVVFQNSWLGDPTTGQVFEDWMTQHRVAPSNADTYGHSYMSTTAGQLYADGVAAYFGLQKSGSTWSPAYDMRPLIHAMMDVESPDMGAYGLNPPGKPGGYTPTEICQALNMDYRASHAWFTWIPTGVTYAPSFAWWPNVVAACEANPLVTTSYPPAYP